MAKTSSQNLTPEFYAAVNSIAAKYGVSPEAVMAVVKTESGFDPMSTSPGGKYIGASQIGPEIYQNTLGYSRSEFRSLPLSEQMKGYDAYLSYYNFPGKMQKAGIDISNLPPPQQAAVLQGFQFAPNATGWMRAYARGDDRTPVTSAKQADALGSTSIADMTRHFSRDISNIAKSVGQSAAGATGALGINFNNMKIELGDGFGVLGKIGNAFLRSGEEPTRNSDGQRITRSDVAKLQGQVNAAGFSPGAIDGRYGPNTAGAVRDFQGNIGISPDGVFGPITANALARYNAAFNGPQLPPTERNINPYGISGNPADLQTMASVPNAALVSSRTAAPPAWHTAGSLSVPEAGTLGTVAALIAAQAAKAKGGPGGSPGEGGENAESASAFGGGGSRAGGRYGSFSFEFPGGGGGGGGGGMPMPIQQNAARSVAGGVAPGVQNPGYTPVRLTPPPQQGMGLPTEGFLGMMASTINPGYDPSKWDSVPTDLRTMAEGITDDQQPPWWTGGETLPGQNAGTMPGMADASFNQNYNSSAWAEQGGSPWDQPSLMSDAVMAPWQQLHAGDVAWPDNPQTVGGYDGYGYYNPMGSWPQDMWSSGYNGSAEWSTPWTTTPMFDWPSFAPEISYGGYESQAPISNIFDGFNQSPTTLYNSQAQPYSINWQSMEQVMGLPPYMDYSQAQWNGGYNGAAPNYWEAPNMYGNQVAPGINPNVLTQIVGADLSNTGNWLANNAINWGASGIY